MLYALFSDFMEFMRREEPRFAASLGGSSLERLDAGMHALGWTRQQIFDYVAADTALSLHEITTETDRYIAWPGQALGYKMGELKIRELRELAESELGEDFDVRDFHDRVLLSGPVTLPVLDDLIRRWLHERTAAE